MRLGELIDKMEAVEQADFDVQEAKWSIEEAEEAGCDQMTKDWMMEQLRLKKAFLAQLRNEEIKL